jgi:hypothetical protein
MAKSIAAGNFAGEGKCTIAGRNTASKLAGYTGKLNHDEYSLAQK